MTPRPDDRDRDRLDCDRLDCDRLDRDRLAATAFTVYLAVGFFVLVYLGSGYWFFADEWGFLVDKQSLADYFRPQNQHWSTAPIVIYQVLYAVFGLKSYLPYQVVVISMHLTLAALIRLVMRRAGVGPWIATVVAGVFVLYGPGDQNILQPVQISMVGTMLCGFGQLLLADHDGRVDRRDWYGLAIGALGLLTSGVAPVLVMACGVAALVRRGWRPALFHTAPLAAIYGAWYLTFRSDLGSRAFTPPPASTIAQWVWSGISGVFLGIGAYAVVGVAMGLVLIGGLVLAWRRIDRPTRRRQAATPVALMVGAVLLFALIPFSARVFFSPDIARSSRYLSMGTAMLLPALAVAIDAMCRRWHAGRPAAMVLLSIGVLLTIGLVTNTTRFNKGAFGEGFAISQRQLVWALANSPLAGQVPRDYHPDKRLFSIDRVPIGFLLDANADGRLPRPAKVDLTIEQQVPIQLGLAQSNATIANSCETKRGTFTGTLVPGQALAINGGVDVAARSGGTLSAPYPFDGATGRYLTVQVQPIDVQVTTKPPGGPFSVCS